MAHWGDEVARRTAARGPLVLGVDPVLEDIPVAFRPNGTGVVDALTGYVRFVLQTAAQSVGFVKFQSAFFEAHGLAGLTALADGIARAKALGYAVILDAKRGDIGSTAAAYAKAYLTPPSDSYRSEFEVDCLTVNPFLGPDGLEPFAACARQYGKGLFVLVKTSNLGSAWLQDRAVDGLTVAETVALLVGRWPGDAPGKSGLACIGAVVGANHESSARALRALMPSAVILSPGLGPQGGSVEAIKALARPQGGGVLAPASRGLTKVENLSVSLEDYAEILLQRIQQYKAILGEAG
jgi:orotidine-5'-phosphate decarboxylase